MSVIKPPEKAVAFAIFRLHKAKGKREDGKQWQSARAERLSSGSDDEGRVINVWPAASFRVKDIRRVFGGGRYRVEWLDATGAKISGETFECIAPAQTDAPMVAPPAAAPGAAPAPTGGGNDLANMSFMELFTFLERRDQAASERAREEARADRERDREFTQTMLTLIKDSRGAGGGEAARSSSADEASLLRRELAVTLKEEVAKIREDLMADDDDDAAPYKPPKNVADAASRVGIKLIEEIEETAPEMLKEGIPTFVAWLKSKGLKLSEELEADVEDVRQRTRNGKKNGKAKHEEEEEGGFTLSEADAAKIAQRALGSA